MTIQQKKEVTKIAKEFASGFDFGGINGTGWLIVDPLSGYLNATGFKNEPMSMPATDKYPQVLLLVFPDGSQFIPAGGDLKPLSPKFKNWMWM